MKTNTNFTSIMNIGETIRNILEQKRISGTELARKINMSRGGLHSVIYKESINTDLLKKICEALDYNFFEDLAKQPMNITRKPNKDSLVNFVNDAELEVKYKKLLEKHVETIDELMKVKLELAKATQK